MKSKYLKAFLITICICNLAKQSFAQYGKGDIEIFKNQFELMLRSETADTVLFKFVLEGVESIDPFYSPLPLSYLDYCIDKATQNNLFNWRGELYAQKGLVYRNLSKKDSAEFVTELALQDFINSKNLSRQLEMHFRLGSMYSLNVAAEKSLVHIYRALEICEKQNDKNGIARSYLIISENKFNFNEHKEALEFAQKSLNLYKTLKKEKEIAFVYAHLAAYQIDSINVAHDYINKAINLLGTEKQDTLSQYATYALFTRINVNNSLGRFDKAMEDIETLDVFIQKSNNYIHKHQLDFLRAETVLKQKNYIKAKDLLLQTINHPAVSINPYLYYNYENLVSTYKNLNQWDSAYYYHMIIDKFENDKRVHESKLKMHDLEAKYENEKKEVVIASQNELLGKHKIIRWISFALIIVLACMLLLAHKIVQSKNKTNLKLKELNEFKTRLYTNITHEFRTPLTVITGMADQMKENPKEWFSEGIIMIKRNSARLLLLVNQILDLSKLESGKIEMNYHQGDIISYLKYLSTNTQSFAESKKLKLHFHSEQEALMMDFDDVKMQQVINNLLSNAIKFTPEDGHIYILIREVEGTDGIKNTQKVQIKIKDTGIGIPEAVLPFIFDRFYQVDDSSIRYGEGSGIGLALVKELVKLMQGEINVTSKVEEGTEFTLILPITKLAPKFKSFAQQANFDTTSSQSKVKVLPIQNKNTEQEKVDLKFIESKQTILLIEDNSDVVAYIASLIQKDYNFLVGKDGLEGIEIALQNIPDIIITDVMMPYKDGFEVCRTLKTNIKTSHIPVIILTAKSDLESKLEGLKYGADDYIMKPFNKSELLARIKNSLHLRIKLQEHYLSILNADETDKNYVEENSLDKQFVQKLKSVVEFNIQDSEFTVDLLCKEMNMSHSQLHRKITALTGLSPVKFIRDRRLSLSKSLLRNKELSINLIASQVGFQDPGYFSRIFKQEVGITPLQWRDKTQTVVQAEQ